MDKLQKTLDNGGGGGGDATPARLGTKTLTATATHGPIDDDMAPPGTSHVAPTPKLLSSLVPEPEQGIDVQNVSWHTFIVAARHSRLLMAATWGQAAKTVGNDCRHIVMVQCVHADRGSVGAADAAVKNLVEERAKQDADMDATAAAAVAAAAAAAAVVVEAKPTVLAYAAAQAEPSPALVPTRRALRRKREDNADQISMLPPILNNCLPRVLWLRQAPHDFIVLKTILEYSRHAWGAAAATVAEDDDEGVERQ
ncbi:hypothetical protein GGF32_004917 [Allomyces javanicus]|nr:hypothetical protein GGF32_004917 [Allomyces javanicus]